MNILIADDESIIRMGLKSMVEQMGYRALTARDGHEALKKAVAYRPDLAILDIQMPKSNGLKLARAIQRHVPMPIIFLTAFSQPELVERATDLNVQGYLLKPVQAEALQAAILVARKRFNEQQSLDEARRRAEQKLEGRKLIDRAKGVLIAGGLSEQEAYAHIQQQARSNNQPMSQIAQMILADIGG